MLFVLAPIPAFRAQSVYQFYGETHSCTHPNTLAPNERLNNVIRKNLWAPKKCLLLHLRTRVFRRRHIYSNQAEPPAANYPKVFSQSGAAGTADACIPDEAATALQDSLATQPSFQLDLEFYNNLIRRATFCNDLVTAVDVLDTMREAAVKPDESTFYTFFPFTLDSFQRKAFRSLHQLRNVVISAPTGSGKTVLGEYAIYRALALGRRVFYTTPLKALSNQKLRDFRQQFGNERVGLLTGDTCINRDAPILVMTTEIYRNMLYGTRTNTPMGQMSEHLEDVHAVVLDEFHFMNDPQRGTVWEEAVIYTPHNILLVALSATMSNAPALTAWINDVHGPTDLIETDHRPVPLQFFFCQRKGLLPLLDRRGTKVNPRLLFLPGSDDKAVAPGRKRWRRNGGRYEEEEKREMSESERRRMSYSMIPSIPFVLSQLQKRDMLPAIYFIFSRRGCDNAVDEVYTSEKLTLVTDAEAALLKEKLDDFRQRYPEEVSRYEFRMTVLMRGVASHHAGMMPVWKSLVEELFQAGLIKVVFATETLAAGINMPARCTVISAISKRSDQGHKLLRASEFLQMAGRAGRRGKDTVGYVVTVQTPYEGPEEAFELWSKEPDALQSHFTPSYGMVLNLLQKRSLEEARDLVERSFSRFLSSPGAAPAGASLFDSMVDELGRLHQQLSSVDWALVASYEKLKQRLKAEQRLVRYLENEADEMRTELMLVTLPYTEPGTIVLVQSPDDGDVKTGVFVSAAPEQLGGKGSTYFLVLTRDNMWHAVNEEHVWAVLADIPNPLDPDALRALSTPAVEAFSRLPDLRFTALGDEKSALAAVQIEDVPEQVIIAQRPPEVEAQLSRVANVESELEAHPVHSLPDRNKLLARRARMFELETELSRKKRMEPKSQGIWQEFLDVADILQKFGCLSEYTPTPMGEACAAVRAENELWLGINIASDVFNHLEPPQLAAALSALVADISRHDVWCSYTPSDEVQDALESVEVVRDNLMLMQEAKQVDFPVTISTDLVGLVEQWASGVEWGELCANTSLDEGDVFRVLRRTLDVLAQVPHIPHIMESLRIKAGKASALMDRFPIAETVE